MPRFQFTAVSNSGETTQGVLFADTTADAVESLSKNGWTATQVAIARNWLPTWSHVSRSSQAAWYSMLADLLASGMPIAKCLEFLAERTSHPALAAATQALRNGVLQGNSLSQAMADHPRIFDPLALCLVAAGEEGAFLESTLSKIADLKEQQAKLVSRLTTAAAYPVFLLLVGSLVMFGMMTLFVPKFQPLFEQMREVGELPWATQTLFAIHHGFVQYWLIITLLIGLAILAIVKLITDPRFRTSRDRYLMKAPLLGNIIAQLVESRFCHVLADLLDSGVRIQIATSLAGRATGNGWLEAAADRAAQKLSSGVSLGDSLGQQGVLSQEVVEMIRLGEKTNRLSAVLGKTSARLVGQADKSIEIALRLIEPMLMVWLAIVLGFVMVALLMPIFNVSSRTFQ